MAMTVVLILARFPQALALRLFANFLLLTNMFLQSATLFDPFSGLCQVLFRLLLLFPLPAHGLTNPIQLLLGHRI